MKLEITQSNLLFQDVQDWRQRRRTKYNELARTISNELQKFEGKNLLALDYVNSGGGEFTPLLFFAEYKGVDPFTFSGYGPYLYFRKPLLSTYIKLNKNKIESSSVRYLWTKVDGKRLWPFRGNNDIKVSVQTTNHFGLIYNNEIVFDTGLHNKWHYSKDVDNCKNSMWDLTAEIFRKKIGTTVDYGNLYSSFEKRFMTSCSFE